MERTQQTADSDNVSTFVRSVRRRLDRHWAVRLLMIAVITASLMMVIIAGGYIVQGYQVPAYWYAVVAGCTLVATLVVWALTRTTDQQAAGFADHYFRLKDAVRSRWNFLHLGKEGGFYELQADQAEAVVRNRDARQIRLKHPLRLSTLAVVLAVVAVSLGFKGTSPAVLEAIARAEATREMTQQVKQQMLLAVKELEASLEDDLQRELLQTDKLRQWVEELKQTDDHKEALRQYAQLERKLTKAAMELQQRREEELLNQAARELRKDENLQELAEKFQQKKYDLAAKDLEAMKSEKLDGKKLSDLQKDLAKLKAAAKRMAAAAREHRQKQQGQQQDRQGKAGQQQRQGDPKAEGQPDQGQRGPQDGQWEESEGEQQQAEQLEQMLEELEEAAEEMDQQMQNMDPSDQSDEDLEACEKCQQGLNQKLDQLGKKLRRMASKRKAQNQLKKLSQRSSEIQAGIAQGRPGIQPGTGESDQSRQERDPLKDNQQYSKLKGIKGQGPSQVKTEEAEEGSGVSGRRSEAKTREYQKQFESFVDREDVPEDLKNGVRNYFIQIHQGGTADSSTEGEPR